MTEQLPSDRDSPDRVPIDPLKRRTFLGVGGGVGAALLAGCASAGNGNGSTEDGSDDGSSGSFRLLISDLPADIGDFDRLDVSFSGARIHRAKDEDDGDDDSEDEDAEEPVSDAESDDTEGDEPEAADENGGEEPEDGDESEEGDEADGEDDEADEKEGDGERAWYEVDLEDATVDLTQVVGDRAQPVYEGELSAGEYTKIELYVSDVEGIVNDGSEADVKVPSEKLKITKSFEVGGDEPVSFVFDINVVKKGNGGYNLLPVISKSGVAGEDVDVEEIDEEDDDESESESDAADGDENADDETESDSDEDATDGGEDTDDEPGNGGNGNGNA